MLNTAASLSESVISPLDALHTTLSDFIFVELISPLFVVNSALSATTVSLSVISPLFAVRRRSSVETLSSFIQPLLAFTVMLSAFAPVIPVSPLEVTMSIFFTAR